MASGEQLVDVMAESLGIKRIHGEDETSFVTRCLYSACRFWIEAFCLDDGYGGNRGIRRQLIARRLREWLDEMCGVYPEMLEWLAGRDNGESRFDVRPLYSQLIMVGDIVSENQGERYRCANLHEVPYGDGACALIGLCDASSSENQRRGILSGMMISISCADVSRKSFNEETYNPRWWDIPDAYQEWTSLSDLPDLEYFDPAARKYFLRESSSWLPEFPDHLEYELARTHGKFADEYYVVKVRKNGRRALRITTDKALSLSLNVRKSFDRPLKAVIEPLDGCHVRIKAPFGLLPTETSRWIDYMTWPVKRLKDSSCRIMRRELLNSAICMMEACGLEIKEK